MADLRAQLESLGYDDVRTHAVAGNALFSASGSAASIEKAIEGAIEKGSGLSVTVMVRTVKQLGAVVADNPFARSGVDRKELHAVFLSGKPSAAKLGAVDPGEYEPDEYAVGDRVLYLRLRNGVMGMTFPDWEKTLGLRATARNWNTVTKLADLAGVAP